MRRVAIFSLLFSLVLCVNGYAQEDANLNVTVSNVPEDTKVVTVVVYDSPQKMAAAQKQKMICKPRKEWKMHALVKDGTATSGQSQVTFADLTPGDYAIMIFCDMNGNGVLDTNRIGFPAEPIGLSAPGAKPAKGKPSWETAKFTARSGSNNVQIEAFKIGF